MVMFKKFIQKMRDIFAKQECVLETEDAKNFTIMYPDGYSYYGNQRLPFDPEDMQYTEVYKCMKKAKSKKNVKKEDK